MKLKHLSNETKEISEGGRFVTLFSAERIFRVGALQAAGIIFTTFVAGFAGSLVIRFNTAVSLPGRVSAIEDTISVTKKRIDEIKNDYTPKILTDERDKNVERQFNEIIKRLDLIQGVLMVYGK